MFSKIAFLWLKKYRKITVFYFTKNFILHLFKYYLTKGYRMSYICTPKITPCNFNKFLNRNLKNENIRF